MAQFIVNAILITLFSSWGSVQLHDSSQIIVNQTMPQTAEDIIINQDAGGDVSRTVVYPTKINPVSGSSEIKASSALVADVKSGLVLFDKNSKEKRSIASVTKLMTALVFLDEQKKQGDVLAGDSVIEFSQEDFREGRRYLNEGEEVAIDDLFSFMLVGSVNSAAATLVRSTGLTQEEFVKKMNEKAKDLKMTDTVFVEPTGLSEDNVSTARDLVKLVYVAMQQPKITQVTSLPEFKFSPKNKKVVYKTYNTDRLLEDNWLTDRKYTFIGGKTGYIEKSGYNFVSQIRNDQGDEVISVVLGTDAIDHRFSETKDIVDWVFSNYNF